MKKRNVGVAGGRQSAPDRQHADIVMTHASGQPHDVNTHVADLALNHQRALERARGENGAKTPIVIDPRRTADKAGIGDHETAPRTRRMSADDGTPIQRNDPRENTPNISIASPQGKLSVRHALNAFCFIDIIGIVPEAQVNRREARADAHIQPLLPPIATVGVIIRGRSSRGLQRMVNVGATVTWHHILTSRSVIRIKVE